MNTELRAPRRKVRPERDAFLPILTAVVVVLVAAAFGLRYYAAREAAIVPPAAPAGVSQESVAPRAEASRPRPIPGAPDMDCGYVNDQWRCYPKPAAPPDDGQPTAAERVQRALRIMESTPKSPARAPAPSRYPTADAVLRWAEQACVPYNEGTIRYRECRARQWRRLRDECIAWRGKLHMASAAEYEQVNAYQIAYCDAERRYQIVK